MDEPIKIIFGKGLDQITVELTKPEAVRLCNMLAATIASPQLSSTAKAAIAVDRARVRK